MELNQIAIFTGNLMSTLTLVFPTFGVKNGSTICIASFKAKLAGRCFTPCLILSSVKNQDSRTEKCESMKIEETRYMIFTRKSFIAYAMKSILILCK